MEAMQTWSQTRHFGFHDDAIALLREIDCAADVATLGGRERGEGGGRAHANARAAGEK
jgi:hypothetical protein